ncbi:MAG: glycosyltransferase family 2 protein [Peptococcaceae bacterium]|nr:glycosyltransferase family 2 protein [Peptococcaceae bacterium]
MIRIYAAVVPTQNESGRIGIVLNNLLKLPFTSIIPVLNGCNDSSLQEVLAIGDPRINPIYFVESLGIDIPRAIGSVYALHRGAEGVIFVDGDMIGEFQNHLRCLITALDQGVDLALVNCYPYITNRQKLTRTVLYFRGQLNRELGLFKDLGLASPTHGPHAISKRLLEVAKTEDIAVPPMILTRAKKNDFKIKVVTSIPHALLNSPLRQRGHARKVAQTIIGDCLAAIAFVTDKPTSRTFGKHTFDGYNSIRRFDLLAEWENRLNIDSTPYLTQHLVRLWPVV